MIDPEAARQPENEYIVSTEQFKDIIDFRTELLRLRPDHKIGENIEAELMNARSHAEALIVADMASGLPVKGPLTVVNGLTLGHLTSPESFENVADRLFRNPLSFNDRVHGRLIVNSILHALSLEESKGLDAYNFAIEGKSQADSRYSDRMIAEGKPDATGFKLLVLAAYWGAAASTRRRLALQDQIAEEFVR
jgi:hypothetical protein